MGKRLKQQRRGKGSIYKSPGHKSKGEVSHRYESEDEENVKGKVVDIIHDPARSAPVAIIKYEDGERRNVLASEKLKVGDEVELGISAEPEPGNVLPLGEIPEGIPIHNIELRPGDGGKLVRSSGTFAFVVIHNRDSTEIRLPSKEFKTLKPGCRAAIGKVAGGGRIKKPFGKAGKKLKAEKARGKKYPTVSGVSMNAVDHPFGGSAKPGKPKTVSRHAPPGKKVGSISPRRTGKKKK